MSMENGEFMRSLHHNLWPAEKGLVLNMNELTFSNGHKMPMIGFGTWKLQPEHVASAIGAALRVGYRHIDCAYVYRNEQEIGSVLKANESEFPRENLFITSKSGDNNFPMTPDGNYFDYDDQVTLADTWKAMEALVDTGLVKSIGLSNFNQPQVNTILDSCRIKPVNLQVECHANFPNHQLIKFAQSRGLTVTGYAPLGSPGASPGATDLLTQDWVVTIGKKHAKTPAQILLRYLNQRSIATIAKSVNASRIAENFKILDFNLSEEEMAILNTSGLNQRQFKMLKLSKHPEYPFTDQLENTMMKN